MGDCMKISLMIFIVAWPIAHTPHFRNCELWYGNTCGIFHASKSKLAGIHSEDIILSEDSEHYKNSWHEGFELQF